MTKRHQRSKHRKLHAWPEAGPSSDEIARRARYVGSPEHKGAWSPEHQPHLRSDASECPRHLSVDPEQNSLDLQRAIRLHCVGADFEEGFPRYVWAWVNGRVWEARHIRGPVGTYKAYGPLEDVELPLDPDGRLAAARDGALR